VDSGIEAGHPRVGAVTRAVALSYDADADDPVRRVEGPHDDLFGHGTPAPGSSDRPHPSAAAQHPRAR
jgi:hypothetical protein